MKEIMQINEKKREQNISARVSGNRGACEDKW